MTRTLSAVGLWLALSLSAAACLWDRDTPRDEARGMPDVVAVLTGRFERNPPLFYEMRLARVAAEIRDRPEDLAAYDDAGVACDRLGRGDEAVAWMGKKKARLDRLDATRPEMKEHLYRYHANLGTFLVHGWVRRGADRSKLGEVKAARDEIAVALAINPNAHFGREKYQALALEWIINPPPIGLNHLPDLLGWEPQAFVDLVEPAPADEAVRGLSGLVALGNAWESVDVFYALNVALQHDTLGFEKTRHGGRNSLAYFAWLRCNELIDAGRGSMHPDAPKGEALKAFLYKPEFVEPGPFLDPEFRKLRGEADDWQSARCAFMLRRLNAGRHPDTDPDFWRGYTNRPAPGLPSMSVPQAYEARQQSRQRTALGVLLGVSALVVGLIVAIAVAYNRRDRRKAILSKIPEINPVL